MAGPTKSYFSLEDYNLVVNFERLKKILLEEKGDERLDRPLAYWALPSDRRLPFAFLGRTLRDLLSTPFEELLATPGVGQKKTASLVTLLTRATHEAPPRDPFGLDAGEEPARSVIEANGARGMGSMFDPALVSEAVWVEWRSTVRRHVLGSLKLGSLAPTLQALPTVIWHTPLSEYMDLSLTDIRQLKTHGEKRVRAILEVFWVVHEALAGSTVKDHLDVQLVPKFVRPVEQWIRTTVEEPRQVTLSDMRESLAQPLLNQVEIDLGQTVWRLASERLGMKARAKSVRQLAANMGVTRARIYQLLEDCGKVMDVRWPEGEHALVALGERLHHGAAEEAAVIMFSTLMAVFYPKSVQAGRLFPEVVKLAAEAALVQ